MANKQRNTHPLRQTIKSPCYDSPMSGDPKEELDRGRPLAVDPLPRSASQTEPAFIARPQGAPVYYGFQILSDVVAQGFTFGKITDFEAEPCEEGDAFVVAPDGSRAGLVWKFSSEPGFQQICPLTAARWGVWDVSFALPMTNRDNVRKNLESILPELKIHWQEWRQKYIDK